ncbi:hypothetical protein T440DRAFT_500281 [Plenodomus tracheiphilus IPT5]|uniref:Uncharacterized protein n=1 Tax=Plenodomus tracheiphilus IPT5 TaxID=1408161 RepID=A0A6A7B027_9PLEO|nr:hypothetical protein T440DRAFT_500281 [Plenodomus tracheiphilus IPT5]
MTCQQYRQSTPLPRPESPRSHIQRQRSNSFPIVEALGCSTPEAQLILAEGRAAVRKRRARGRRNRSVNDESITTFDPRDHVKYLHDLSLIDTPQERPIAQESQSCHARIPSNATDDSSRTVVPLPHDNESSRSTSPTSPLGDYSANLAQFIKAQLKSILTYKPYNDAAPLSPRSCPDLSFPLASPPQSPTKVVRRPAEAPKVITIPPIRPPMLSAFSAWSSTTDDDTDEEALPLPGFQANGTGSLSKVSSHTPSILGYYDLSNTSSFLFSSTPVEEESDPDTAKGLAFPEQSILPAASAETHDDDDYPSSSHSRPQLTSSAPSYTSSTSNSSYFDCKRPTTITSAMKERIVAAVTPPHPHDNKMLTAISPWEGGALANVHDVFIESQQRVHVDGMSFDMLRDFVSPGGPTPC